MTHIETTTTDAETTTTGVKTTTTDVETTMTDVETTKTDIGTTTTDVKKAMTDIEKTMRDVETPTADVKITMADVKTTTTDVKTTTTDFETATTDAETTLRNVGTSVTQTTVTNNVEATNTDAETAATEAEAATASDELVINDPAALQVVNNIDSLCTTAGSPVDNNLHPYTVESATCTCISASLCCYGCIRETIRDLEAHFDRRIKAVCTNFHSKPEGIQTENAQLLELVKKYKSTADRCQRKLHDLLSRHKSEHDSRLSVNEYAATRVSAPDTQEAAHTLLIGDSNLQQAQARPECGYIPMHAPSLALLLAV